MEPTGHGMELLKTMAKIALSLGYFSQKKLFAFNKHLGKFHSLELIWTTCLCVWGWGWGGGGEQPRVVACVTLNHQENTK